MADWTKNNEFTEELLEVDEDEITFEEKLYDSDWLEVIS